MSTHGRGRIVAPAARISPAGASAVAAVVVAAAGIVCYYYGLLPAIYIGLEAAGVTPSPPRRLNLRVARPVGAYRWSAVVAFSATVLVLIRAIARQRSQQPQRPD